MAWIDEIRHRLTSLRHRDQFEDELDDELRFHLEMEIERRIEAGASRAEATRAARLDFGAPEAVKEAVRESWGTRWLDDGWRDLQGAVRQALKTPTLSLVVAGSLAVGLGAAAVIFSLFDAVLLRPLPYDDPKTLVSLQERTPEDMPFSVSEPNLIDFDTQTRTLDGAAGIYFPNPSPSLEREGSRVHLEGHAVTPNFFAVVGVQARIGRTFEVTDLEADGDPRVVVLSDSGWRHHFGSDPEVVGSAIDLGGERFTVLGVLPEGFRVWGPVDVFLPRRLDPEFQRGDRRLTVLARLAPGVTLPQAREEVGNLANRLGETFPKTNEGWGVALDPIDEFLLGEELRQNQWMLLGAVALLLLLVGVNVSNLLLARGDDRMDEMRLRLALGAGRARVVRQLLTETLFLGALGTLGAILLATAVVPWIRNLNVNTPRIDTMVLDARTLGAVAVVALVTSLLCGLIPALRSTKASGSALARTRRQGSGIQSRRLRRGLVVAEVALATVLAVGAGLLFDSFGALQTVDSGITTEEVVLARIDLPQDRYPEGSDEGLQFFDRWVEKAQALPGVSSAALSAVHPYVGPGLSNNVAIESELDRNAYTPIHWRSITSDYFRTFGIPLLRGDTFDDQGPKRRQAVISADLATRLWPNQDPIGQQMRWVSPEGPLLEVIGVVPEIQDLQLGGLPRMTVYVPQRLMGWSSMTLALRTQTTAESVIPAFRQTVGEIDPLLAPPQITTLAGLRREALGGPLLSLRLVAVAALIAVLLSAIGVYGMVAYAVSQRQRELGVRLALGARSRQLVGMVIGDGARWVGFGLVVGLVAALGLAGLLQALLYQTSPTDPQVLSVVAGLLLAVGLLACALPALRAGKVDPITTLRQE